MANRLNLDANRLFGALTFLVIVMLLVGFATVGGGDLAIFSVAALVGAVGGAIGATAFLAWRHYHGGSPFIARPGETLHLR